MSMRSYIFEQHSSEQEQLALVSHDPNSIANMPYASEAVQIAAVSKFGHAIKFIENPSEAVQLAAVTSSGQAIRYIDNPSEEVQLAAVRQNGYAIKRIQNPSEAVKLETVKNYPWMLSSIANPSKAVVLTALVKMIKEQDIDLTLFVTFKQLHPDWPEWPTIEHGLSAIGVLSKGDTLARFFESIKVAESYRITPAQRLNLSNASEEEQLAAVTHDWKNLRYIKNPSEAVQMAAIEQHPVALTDISNPTYAVKLAAVKDYGGSVRWIRGTVDKRLVLTAVLTMIKNQENAYEEIIAELQEEYPDFPEWAIINKSLAVKPKELAEAINLNTATEEEQIAAVSSRYSAIEEIRNPSEAVQIAAVGFYPLNIKYIWEPCIAAQLTAVKKDPDALFKIKNLSSKQVIMTAIMGYIKLHGSNFLGSTIYNKFRAKYPNWPEWKIIDKSLRSSGKILRGEGYY